MENSVKNLGDLITLSPEAVQSYKDEIKKLTLQNEELTRKLDNRDRVLKLVFDGLENIHNGSSTAGDVHTISKNPANTGGVISE